MKALNLLLWLPLLLSCAAAPPSAPPPDAAAPSAIPPYGEDKPLPPPDLTQRTLANGLTVWVLPRSGVPRVEAILAVRGGQAADPAAQGPALSNLLADLLDEGTARRSSRGIAEELQAIGGNLDASAAPDGFVVAAGALASHAPQLLDLLADVARHPAFPNKEVALARDNARQELAASEAEPGFVAERAWAATVYGTHPYARAKPTAKGIQSVTRPLLRREHARRFRPDRALLVLCGRLTAEEGLALAEKAFGAWRGSGTVPPDTPAFAPAGGPKRVLVERPGSVQSSLRFGRAALAAPAPDFVPLQLTSTILGGSFSSRLMQNLREEKGYTYGAGVGVRANRAGGALYGVADVRNEVTGAAIGEFFKEYERLGRDGVDAAELQKGKRYAAGVFVYRNQPQAAMARTLASQWLVGLPPEYFIGYVQRVQAVTAEQVRDMARRYYAPGDQSLIVVGDKAAIAEQLAPLGKFAAP